jgi:hypothetical protein
MKEGMDVTWAAAVLVRKKILSTHKSASATEGSFQVEGPIYRAGAGLLICLHCQRHISM